MTPTPLRGSALAHHAARAAVFATVSTVLALTAHHLASGDPARWQQGVLAAGALAALALPVARALRSLPGTVAATLAAQYGLHLWLGTAATATQTQPHAAHPAGHAGAPTATWHTGHHDGWSMPLLHVAAALAVAWCLQRADAACRAAARAATTTGHMVRSALLRTLSRWHDRPRPATAPVRLAGAVGRPAPAPPRGVLLLADAVVRRGPPATGFLPAA